MSIPPPLGLLSASAAVSKGVGGKVFRSLFVLLLRSLERIVGIYFLFYRNEFRGRRQS